MGLSVCGPICAVDKPRRALCLSEGFEETICKTVLPLAYGLLLFVNTIADQIRGRHSQRRRQFL